MKFRKWHPKPDQILWAIQDGKRVKVKVLYPGDWRGLRTPEALKKEIWTCEYAPVETLPPRVTNLSSYSYTFILKEYQFEDAQSGIAQYEI